VPVVKDVSLECARTLHAVGEEGRWFVLAGIALANERLGSSPSFLVLPFAAAFNFALLHFDAFARLWSEMMYPQRSNPEVPPAAPALTRDELQRFEMMRLARTEEGHGRFGGRPSALYAPDRPVLRPEDMSVGAWLRRVLERPRYFLFTRSILFAASAVMCPGCKCAPAAAAACSAGRPHPLPSSNFLSHAHARTGGEGVNRISGCNHMTCTCGTHFDYVTGMRT
jgi:hypothetical protein